MEQTFNDLLRERAEGERGLFGFLLWMFAETFAGIVGENMTALTMHRRGIIRIALVTALILMVPLVAMQFSDEWNWTLFDFVWAGTLIFAVGMALAGAFLLVWLNAAVGVIGNEANPMYVGVLAVGIIGAVIARLRPQGMSRVLFATALAQALVAVIALSTESNFPWHEVRKTLTLTGFFVALFVGSALLFRRASASDPK